MKPLFIFTTAAATAFASSAIAQGTFDGALTLGYSSADLEGADLSTLSLRAETTLMLGENFDIGLDFTTTKTDIDELPLDLGIVAFDISPRYHFGNGFSIGAYYEQGDLNLDAESDLGDIGLLLEAIDIGSESYGLTAGYAQDNWEIEGFIGATDLKPLISEFVDINNVGIRGTFNVTDQLTLGGYVTSTKFEIDLADETLRATSVGIAAFYEINDNFSVFGGLSNMSLNEFGLDLDVRGTSIGVAYDLEGIMTIPAMFSLEYVNTDISLGGPDIDGSVKEWRIGVTIPLGGKTGSRPLNSHAHHILDGNHDVLSSLGGTF